MTRHLRHARDLGRGRLDGADRFDRIVGEHREELAERREQFVARHGRAGVERSQGVREATERIGLARRATRDRRAGDLLHDRDSGRRIGEHEPRRDAELGGDSHAVEILRVLRDTAERARLSRDVRAIGFDREQQRARKSADHLSDPSPRSERGGYCSRHVIGDVLSRHVQLVA